jgi:ribosomal protein L19E
MEHSDTYSVIKKHIQDGEYKKNMKRLANELKKLREYGHITQEEYNELLKLNSEIVSA